ncbi:MULTISPECIES: DUF2964 family protein [Pandoraea]|uniref:DUF2964 family protein n=1 Tax=Pandoraea TaxID=93217 RepID=UPI001F5CFA49|nr:MULTISPECIES: DUF2964 family protein [Pandoraea]MCI3207784.1 hypothetical protein [Pandoraea sp. LA3]MDN4585813.1 hypothetical protein [Pandoraea capi]
MCSDSRVFIASLAAFVMLGGIFATIHGLLYNLPEISGYGVAAVLLGATCTATMLIPWGERDKS